jgi:iron complex transport system ATP-binding protein
VAAVASPERGARVAAGALRFAFSGRPVLAGVELRAEPGEIVGLAGPNGSGKSTLIRIFSGVLAGYQGQARIGGVEVRAIPRRELALRVAVVPQEPVFGFPFTAIEVVLMGRHPHLAGLALETAHDVRVAREALERCGAAELAYRPIHELSSGERQRVVFAKALAQEAPVLLLDEPASFLDLRHQVELYDVVRSLAEQGRTVLTVLHDLNLAAEYCDRLCLLHEGRIAAAGETSGVLTRENLTRVFGTEVHVEANAVTGRLLVIPLPGRVLRERAGRGLPRPAEPGQADPPSRR